MAQSEKIVTPRFRAAFVSVFRAKAQANGGEPKYSIAMLFPKAKGKGKDPVKTMLENLLKAAVDATSWDDKTKQRVLSENIPKRIKDGDLESYAGYEGNWAINASNARQPGVIDADKTELHTADEFYSGCYARATITAYTWEKGEGYAAGVGFSLGNLQKLADGDRLDGSTTAEDDFDAVDQEAPE